MKIYFFPFLMDMVLFLAMMRVSDAAGRTMHLSNFQTAAFMGVQSLAYLLFCPVAGFLLTRRNARAMLLLSTIAMLGLSIPIYFAQRFGPTVALIAGTGMAAAFFFNSFQTFMRGEAPPGSLKRTISRYNFSWSAGIACGFLFGGVLITAVGPLGLAGLSAATCIVIGGLILLHRRRPLDVDSSDGVIEHSPRMGRPVDGRYVMIGWLLSFLLNFTQRPIMTFLPKFYAESNHAAWMAGALIFSMLFIQAVGGWWMHHLRHWLYRRTFLMGAHLLLAAGLALLWLVPLFWPSLAALMLLGVVYGYLFFAGIYYVSNDPRSSFNVGINEAVVGLGTVVGVLGCERIMHYFMNDRAYLPAAIGVTLVLMGIEWFWLKAPRTAAATPQPALGGGRLGGIESIPPGQTAGMPRSAGG